MTETFIRIAAGHYRNVGTGVEIVRVSADEAGQRGWHVTTPTVSGFEVVAIGATMREVKDAYVTAVREAYAAIEQVYGEAVTEHVDRAEARAEAAGVSTWRADAARRMATYDHPNWVSSVLAEVRRLDEWVAYEGSIEQEIDEDEAWSASDTTWRQTTEQAHTEAQAMGIVKSADSRQAEDDDLIHFWVGDRAPSACGVDIWTTPYTYGSPELDEVTCDACKGREQHRQFVARVGEHRTANGGSLVENRRMVIDNDHAEALEINQNMVAVVQTLPFVTRAHEYRHQHATGILESQQAIIDQDHLEALVIQAVRDMDQESCTCDSPAQRMYPHAAHREAPAGFREHGEPVWFEGSRWTVEHVAIGVAGYICLTLESDDPATGRVRNVYADEVIDDNHDEALREQAKRDAAQVIAGARAPFILCALHGSDCRSSQNGRPCSGMPKVEWTYKPIAPGAPEVPADLDDDAAWAAYCAALPPATDRQIADVLAEYGDPYAALRAEVVGHLKDTARMAWKIRSRGYDDALQRDMLAQLQATMRTLRGVIETYDMLTESWPVSVRTDTDRDAATQAF